MKIKAPDTFILATRKGNPIFGRVTSLLLCTESHQQQVERRSYSIALMKVYEQKGIDQQYSLRQQLKWTEQVIAISLEEIEAVVNFVPQQFDWMLEINKESKSDRRIHWTDWQL